jgi:hypothetical protein
VLTFEQQTALAEIGVPADRTADFVGGKPIAFTLATESEPGIAAIWHVPPRLSCGIVEIVDPGGGVKTFARFRGQAHRLAALLGAAELEIFGAEVLNERLKAILLRQGYEERTADCPDELGDEKMSILARTSAV